MPRVKQPAAALTRGTPSARAHLAGAGAGFVAGAGAGFAAGAGAAAGLAAAGSALAGVVATGALAAVGLLSPALGSGGFDGNKPSCAAAAAPFMNSQVFLVLPAANLSTWMKCSETALPVFFIFAISPVFVPLQMPLATT